MLFRAATQAYRQAIISERAAGTKWASSACNEVYDSVHVYLRRLSVLRVSSRRREARRHRRGRGRGSSRWEAAEFAGSVPNHGTAARSDVGRNHEGRKEDISAAI